MKKLMVAACIIFVTAIAAQADSMPAEAAPTTGATAEAVVATPAMPAPVAEDSVKTIWFEIGPEIFFHEYREEAFMKETGTFYGIAGALTGHDSGVMGAFQFEYAQGLVNYDGGNSQGSSFHDNIRDKLADVRALVGPDFEWNKNLTTVYLGIGYRYLKDGMGSWQPGGYDRESNYIYLPLGTTTTVPLGDGWSLGGTAEFDLLLYGQQKSYMSDYYGVDFTNTQRDGWGARGSLSVEKKFGDIAIKVQPFVRYWFIDDSEKDKYGAGIEPKNRTTQSGVQLLFVL